MRGFLEMVEALNKGENVVQTADIPKGTPRRVGNGIIRPGRKNRMSDNSFWQWPQSRRYTFTNAWDRASLSLPFGRTAICMGSIIRVSETRDQQEQSRIGLENEMKRITTKAYNMVGVTDE